MRDASRCGRGNGKSYPRREFSRDKRRRRGRGRGGGFRSGYLGGEERFGELEEEVSSSAGRRAFDLRPNFLRRDFLFLLFENIPEKSGEGDASLSKS